MQVLAYPTTWDKVRDDSLFHHDPEFCSLVDKLDPGKDYPIVEVNYFYGNTIYSQGHFYLPTSEKYSIPVTDARVPQKIQEYLTYKALPLGFMTGNGVEVFTELEDRVFCTAYFRSGLQIGVWETFAPATPFNITAGARSLLMLPKAAEATSHKKLRRFGVQAPVARTSFDQWYIFKQAAMHKDFYTPWSCKILLLTRPWVERMEKDAQWQELKHFILQRAWDHTRFGRNKLMLDIVWESFSRLLTNKRIKPNSYIVDTLKHLIFIAMGAIPGFKPVTDNNAAPVDGFCKMYLEDYGLKSYTPSIMQPAHFSLNGSNEPIYYSLQVPTYLESIPKYRHPSSARNDLAELIALIDEFMHGLVKNRVCDRDGHVIFDVMDQICFDYFHSEEDSDNNIRSSKHMPDEDPRLLYLPTNTSGERKFCERSTFTRGCIRVSKRK